MNKNKKEKMKEPYFEEEQHFVMDTTNGNLVAGPFDTYEEALYWVEDQTVPEMYEVSSI